MTPGVDVSAVQGRINHGVMAHAGIRFAIVKCTEGNRTGVDPFFHVNVDGFKRAGIYVGAYHFAYSLPTLKAGDGRTPQEEAKRYFKASGGLGQGLGELPPAIDAEWPPPEEWSKWGCTAKQISEWHRVMATEVAQLWGRAPLIYTYPHWWRYLSTSTDVSWAVSYQLWIANYMAIQMDAPPAHARPIVPKPWDEFTIWQWSADKGKRVAGCMTDIDRNLFRGDLDGLRRLANVSPDAPTVRDVSAEADAEIVHPRVPLGRPALDNPDDE